MTSCTPWPPTDLMARSTSFNPKVWVVTFSSGKRCDASCCSASSQALKMWPRALLMVMNFTVTFPTGKFGNSAISPWITIVPPLRLSASTPRKIGMVPAPALDGDELHRNLPDREVREFRHFTLDHDRAALALERLHAKQDRDGSRARS